MMMSGGNTQIVYVKDYTEFEVLGKTRDDAIGEAFDKVARVVGLSRKWKILIYGIDTGKGIKV